MGGVAPTTRHACAAPGRLGSISARLAGRDRTLESLGAAESTARKHMAREQEEGGGG